MSFEPFYTVAETEIVINSGVNRVYPVGTSVKVCGPVEGFGACLCEFPDKVRVYLAPYRLQKSPGRETSAEVDLSESRAPSVGNSAESVS